MEWKTREVLATSIQTFKLPRYDTIPDVGLYLEQITKYIGDCLAPLQNMSITASMIGNYVKKGLVDNPVKKQYSREQIAYLMFIAVAKTVVSLEDIQELIALQKKTYDTKTAYEYFCREFENVLFFVFGLKDTVENVGSENSAERILLRNMIITVAHKVYLDKCFAAMRLESEQSAGEMKKS